MNLKTHWQKTAPAWQKVTSVWRGVADYFRKRIPVWKRFAQKAISYALVAVLASALTATVFAIQGMGLKDLTAEREALEESKQELAQTLTQTETLLNQLLTANKDTQDLLQEAQREEGEVADKIDELKGAYDAAEESALQHWVVPMKYTMCTSYFGLRLHPIEGEAKFHSGVDLAASVGTPIVASRGGRVTVAEYEDQAGYHVAIDHGDGYVTRYMHMSRYIVTSGQVVITGQVIGFCGASGAATGAHLHFGVYYDGKAVDPAQYIDI